MITTTINGFNDRLLSNEINRISNQAFVFAKSLGDNEEIRKDIESFLTGIELPVLASTEAYVTDNIRVPIKDALKIRVYAKYLLVLERKPAPKEKNGKKFEYQVRVVLNHKIPDRWKNVLDTFLCINLPEDELISFARNLANDDGRIVVEQLLPWDFKKEVENTVWGIPEEIIQVGEQYLFCDPTNHRIVVTNLSWEKEVRIRIPKDNRGIRPSEYRQHFEGGKRVCATFVLNLLGKDTYTLPPRE